MTKAPNMGNLFGGDNSTDHGWLNLPQMRLGQEELGQEELGRAPHIDIAVMGIGAATPYPVGSYCMEAPDAIRNARSWPGILGQHDFDLYGVTPSPGILPQGVTAADFGNLDVVDSAAPEDTAENRAKIQKAVASFRQQGAIPFIFGGDDSVPIPVLAAYDDVDQPISILQIDAHIDWRDEVNNEKNGLSSNMRRASEMAHIGKIVQLGARGIGSARAEDLQDALDYGTSFHTTRMLKEDGGIDRALADLPQDVPVYIALDIDSLDPVLMPAVIGAAQGGLTYDHLMAIFEGVAKRAPIIGFNLVELMPGRDVNNQGALMASRVAISMLGIIAQQCAKQQRSDHHEGVR